MRLALLAVIALLAPQVALAQSCPEPLVSAKRLVLVTADTLNSTTVTVERFERLSTHSPWEVAGGPATALIGHNGLAWSQAFRRFAKRGEPIKVEGDKRAPAGFFKIGPSFGFAASQVPNYVRIDAGMVCVDDPSSPAYNTITRRDRIGPKVHPRTCRACQITPRAAGRLPDRLQGARRLVHLHSSAIARKDWHQRLRGHPQGSSKRCRFFP